MEIITSRTNEQIKEIVKLFKNKKERYNKGLFAIEGLKILKEAYRNKINLVKIFVSAQFLEENKFDADFQKMLNHSKVLLITQDLCKKISENCTPQEVFAICEIPKKLSLENVINESFNILMLLGLQDVGNFGTIIRTGAAMGVDCILISRDCPDVYSLKVIRAAMGMMFHVKLVIIDDVFKTLNLLKRQGFKTYATALHNNSQDLRTVKFSKKNVIVLGNEGNGLSNDFIDACDEIVKIPMKSNVESLNVAVASGIVLWQLQNHNM